MISLQQSPNRCDFIVMAQMV